ncbi:molybdopterin-dependent oxidoreductase [Clostridium estertheticum]|uniref:molybdopterin-containing oxidoreductase family protein n=1 Tax=Clostridium estertheticum TaxID=238834 RepID=UPI001C0BA402|nr:molybdopterin-dependent oxidoreductase [Clostridium estertheticum]MBU3214682.1 molybdopterin-dependent oxidoreductase [Clostridium estertheticum]WAG57097.1 molybdopterin-dependent oxidoreductase [Clostridium estertheticum]
MNKLEKTSCAFCGSHCGLEMEIENNRIVNVRPDPDNPRTKGYCCRKGRSSKYFQNNTDRLNYPLKRVGKEFVRISWEQAFTEIAEKLCEILDKYGPRAVGNVGGAGAAVQGEGPYVQTFMKMVGSQYSFSPTGLEFMGLFWNVGKMIGDQSHWIEPDEQLNEVLVMWGCNSYVSHQTNNARRFTREICEDPDRMYIVVDPRLSETARMADMHIALRPGTDALLVRAMITLIIQEGWQHQEYLDKWVSDFDKVKPWFTNFDIKEACRVCEVPYEQVRKLCRILTTRKWGVHQDLGIFMGRHNTMSTSLLFNLICVCGVMFVSGGSIAWGGFASVGNHTDDQDPKIWRTLATGFAPVTGIFPTAVLPAEIMNDNPNRIRALLMSTTNPVRSFPDSTAQGEAYSKLDLLVCSDICMTETAKYAHYVLPAMSAYEAYDFSVVQCTYPEIYCMLKHPVVQPEGERMESGEIWLRLGDAMGFIPTIPDSLYETARNKSRMEYFGELMVYLQNNPEYMPAAPFIIGKTLGKAMGSAHKAMFWGALMLAPQRFQEEVPGAGFKPGPAMMDDVFQAVCDHPEGVLAAVEERENNFKYIVNDDKKIHLFVDVLDEYIKDITPEKEEQALIFPKEYPLILSAGRHTDGGHNGFMRNPATYEYRNPCTLAINPEDGKKLGLKDGQMTRVTTEAGSVEIEAQFTYQTRKGYVLIPHQFGFDFNGKRYGVGVNTLTSVKHIDKLTGNPILRYVPCRVEAI